MKRTWRTFSVVYLVLMAVSLWDYVIRLPTWSDASCLEALKVVAGSSAPSVLVASLVFLAGDAFWLVCMPLTVWLLLTTGAFAFLQHYCWGRGLVGEAFTVSVITLNADKVLGFVAAHPVVTALIAVFLMLILALVMWMASVRVDGVSRGRIAIGAILLGVGGCAVFHAYEWDHLSMALFDQRLFQACDGAGMYFVLSEAGRPVRPGAWRTEETNLFAVVMVGESSSRLHWSLYGYGRKTTPRLDALAPELAVFSNLTATVGFTPYALRDTFTVRTEGVRVSLPSLATAAGCDCRFVSAQAKWGFFCGSDELLFRACRDRLYLPRDEKDVRYDDELVPHVLSAVPDVPTNRVLFAHMVGSHVPFADRCPKDRTVFDPGLCDREVEGLPSDRRSEVNRYDNSIAFTDSVLAETIERLRKTQRPVVLVYLSDHGESPRTCLRDLNSRETFAIPFFVWASPACGPQTKARMANVCSRVGRELKSTDCLPILLEVLGIVRDGSVRLR